MRTPLLLVAVLAVGCTYDHTESSEDVRGRYLDRHQDTFLLTDRAKAVEALEGVLAEEGYALVPTEKPAVFRTDNKMDRKSTSECSIHLLMLLNGALFVQIMEIDRDESGKVTHKKRREDLEWLVAQRADPDRAFALMNKANERADKVPAITRKQ